MLSILSSGKLQHIFQNDTANHTDERIGEARDDDEGGFIDFADEEEGMEITFRVSWLHLFGEISSIIKFLLLFFLSCIMLSDGNEIIDCIIVLLSGLLYVLLSNLYLHFFYEKEKQIAIEDLKSLVL